MSYSPFSKAAKAKRDSVLRVSPTSKPDKSDKGLKGGSCNRQACQRPGANYFNHSTRAYYCKTCADWLNTDKFNREYAEKNFGHPLCTLDAS